MTQPTKKPIQPGSVEELVLLAEKGMGWIYDHDPHNLTTHDGRWFYVMDGKFITAEGNYRNVRSFNPRNRIADAVELADKVFDTRNTYTGIDTARNRFWSCLGLIYNDDGNVASSHFHKSYKSECDAICNAALEFLTREGQDAN